MLLSGTVSPSSSVLEFVTNLFHLDGRLLYLAKGSGEAGHARLHHRPCLVNGAPNPATRRSFQLKAQLRPLKCPIMIWLLPTSPIWHWGKANRKKLWFYSRTIHMKQYHIPFLERGCSLFMTREKRGRQKNDRISSINVRGINQRLWKPRNSWEKSGGHPFTTKCFKFFQKVKQHTNNKETL